MQHIDWHCAAGVPPRVQLWKHDMLLAHWASFRQLVVSSQQLPTMHWLHGVPPGSSEQVPASTPMPQWPLSQARPTQHSWLFWQLDPGGRQVPAPQAPFWQTMLQHSDGLAQEKPSSLQVLTPQRPLSQAPLQHWLGWLHPNPSGVHMVKPQVPVCGLHVPLQQSRELAQGRPSR